MYLKNKAICDQILSEINVKGIRAQSKSGKGQVKDYLDKSGVLKLAGSDEIHPRVFEAVAEAIPEPLVIIFENAWKTGESLRGMEKAKCSANVYKRQKGKSNE